MDVDVPVPDGVTVPGDEERPGNRVRLVLPPGYDVAVGSEHPMLLLLHGAGDGSETWVENTDVEAFVAELCATDPSRCPVVVMPDGGGKHSQTGWYTDWHDGSRQWETFHLDGVLPWARDALAVGSCRESTLVAGLSMGGFGALSYAGRHPDQFVAAGSFSGFLDIRPAPPVSTIGFQLAQDGGLGAPTSDMFGPPGLLIEEDGWSAHNPTDLARAGAYHPYRGNLWVSVGTGTPGGPAGDDPADAASYALEQFLFDLTQNFRLAMIQSGSTFHDHSYVGGNHDWPYWQYSLRRALPEMLGAVAACDDADPRGAVEARPVAALPSATASDAELPGTLPATGGNGLATVSVLLAIAGLCIVACRDATQRLFG